MPLYHDSGVSVESWVEMTSQVPMHYEIDGESDQATLFFGQHNNYVLVLNHDNLAEVLSLGEKALCELEAFHDRGGID